MNKEDSILINQCKKNNRMAQLQLYEKYAKLMFNIALRYVSDKENAKDVMQEGFLKAFVNINTYQPKFSFGSWLKRIIINQALDELRKRKLNFSDDEVENLNIINDDDWNFESFISKQDILLAIEQLDAKQNIVVKLYLIEGYDHQEISEILNIPATTSRTYLSRGKHKLRALLKQKYNEARY